VGSQIHSSTFPLGPPGDGIFFYAPFFNFFFFPYLIFFPSFFKLDPIRRAFFCNSPFLNWEANFLCFGGLIEIRGWGQPADAGFFASLGFFCVVLQTIMELCLLSLPYDSFVGSPTSVCVPPR